MDSSVGEEDYDGPSLDQIDSLSETSCVFRYCGAALIEHASEGTDELSLLRMENSLLRKKIKELEKTSRSGKKHSIDQTELERIDQLLKKAEDAKHEALNYVANTSREKLGQDVKVLQSILNKAKAERHSFKKKIKESQEKLLSERSKIEQEEVRYQVDREIFAKILKDDRDRYNNEVALLVQKMAELQKEKYDLFLWAKEQQEKHLQEMRKLTRALGRTKRAVDEQRLSTEQVLQDIYQAQAAVRQSEPLATPSA